MLLLLCVLVNALVVTIFKFFPKYKIDNFQAITFNYLTCVVVAMIHFRGVSFIKDLPIEPWFYYAAGLGIVFMLVFNAIAYSIQSQGLMITTVFQKMSLLAPVLAALIFYNEDVTLPKISGITAGIVSVFCLTIFGEKKKEKSNLLTLSLIVLFGSAVIDLSFYLLNKTGLVPTANVYFLSALFLMAGLAGVFAKLYLAMRGRLKIEGKNVLAGIILGVPNFFSIYLLMKVLESGLDGSIVFPINNIGILIITAIVGISLFSEKVNKIKYIGFALAVLSIILLSIPSIS